MTPATFGQGIGNENCGQKILDPSRRRAARRENRTRFREKGHKESLERGRKTRRNPLARRVGNGGSGKKGSPLSWQPGPGTEGKCLKGMIGFELKERTESCGLALLIKKKEPWGVVGTVDEKRNRVHRGMTASVNLGGEIEGK